MKYQIKTIPIEPPIYLFLPPILSRDLAETIESRPLCITDLFQNKSVAYLKFIKKFPSIKKKLFNADIKIFLEKF